MEEVAVLRQFMVQIKGLCDLYGYRSPPPFDQLHHRYERWVYLDLDDSSFNESYYDLTGGGKFVDSEMTDANKTPSSKMTRGDHGCGKMLTFTRSHWNMEHKIWQEIPEDILEAVLARLPMANIFNFRLVCRKWKFLLTSQRFSRICAEVQKAYPWFYTISHQSGNTGAVYDPSLRKWHHMPLPFLSEKMMLLPVNSAGSLVCFVDVAQRNFFVCNPLTRSFKELPPQSFLAGSRVAVGMVSSGKSCSCGYKIMLLTSSGEFSVYDSIQGCWTRPGIVPSSIRLPLTLNFSSHTLAIGSCIYFMRFCPSGIISYDLATDTWKQFSIPLPPYVADKTLIGSKGKVMLVGLLNRNAATCICIWELQKMTLLWKEVDRMPSVWSLDFYGKQLRMQCLGNRGLLLLSMRSAQMNCLVSYDLTSREWQKVPECILPGEGKQWVGCGTAFYPCPASSA